VIQVAVEIQRGQVLDARALRVAGRSSDFSGGKSQASPRQGQSNFAMLRRWTECGSLPVGIGIVIPVDPPATP
jgi:hypothetical protein